MGGFLQGPSTTNSGGVSSGAGLGALITFSPSSGTIDPSIAGFTAALGPTGTGRINITLSGNTSFEGLPAGVDGQQLFLTIVSGNFTLTLLHLDGATGQQQIRASSDNTFALNTTAQLFYDSGLAQWVLVPGTQASAAIIPAPALLPDLLWWLAADTIQGTNGTGIPVLGNATPWVLGPLASLAGGLVTVDSTQLNGHNVVKWPGTANGRYNLNTTFTFSQQVTVFAVVKPVAPTNQTLLGASQNGFEVDVNSGAGGFSITKALVASIASTTATLIAGTWYQFNVTYDATTGAYSFRVSQTAAGSGTSGVTGIAATTSGLGYNVAAVGADLSSSVAEVVVCQGIKTSPQILSVESYFNSKWGV